MINSVSINGISQLYCTGQKKRKIDSPAENTKKGYTSEVLAYGVAAASIGALIKHRIKLGKLINLIDENVPNSISKRIDKLGEMSSIDGMTKLGNKTNFEINAIKDYRKAVEADKNFGIGMLDMDNFKAINEVKDHLTGDIFLQRIALHTKRIADKYGAKAYRYGGEEFIITSIGKSNQEMKKIMEKISFTIKNDPEIQKYLPDFIKSAKKQIEPIEKEIKFCQINIFDRLRKKTDPIEKQKIKKNIKRFINSYTKKYEPIDKKELNDILEALNSPTFKMKLNTQIGNDSLQVHLDKLVSPYKDSKNDLMKWLNHMDKHNAFTISGGYASISPNTNKIFETSKSLVDVADLSLKSAKINGKNTIIEAPQELI